MSRLWPIAITLVVTTIWRRLALGTWAGGYPGGVGAAFPGGADGQLWVMLTAAAKSLGVLAWFSGFCFALMLGLGLASGWKEDQKTGLWLLAGGVLCSLGSMAFLVTFLAAGEVPPEHERILLMADIMLILGMSSLFVVLQNSTNALRHMPLVLFLALAGLRAKQAWADTHDWARAGNLAAGIVAEISGNLDDIPASPYPVLSYSPPGAIDGAYVLQWGVADYFRPPFAETPRPVWPWRPSGFGSGLERKSVTVPKRKLRWPFGIQPRTVPFLQVTTAGPDPQPVTELSITTAIVESGGPTLRIQGSFPGARFEALLFTELGYSIGLYGTGEQHGPMQAPAKDSGQPIPEPFGGTIALLDLLKMQPGGEGSGGPALWEGIAQAADFGATDAYLELRAVDDAKGITNRPVGASSWIHLTWAPELRNQLLPMDQF